MMIATEKRAQFRNPKKALSLTCVDSRSLAANHPLPHTGEKPSGKAVPIEEKNPNPLPCNIYKPKTQ